MWFWKCVVVVEFMCTEHEYRIFYGTHFAQVVNSVLYKKSVRYWQINVGFCIRFLLCCSGRKLPFSLPCLMTQKKSSSSFKLLLFSVTAYSADSLLCLSSSLSVSFLRLWFTTTKAISPTPTTAASPAIPCTNPMPVFLFPVMMETIP